jgi:alanine racemase
MSRPASVTINLSALRHNLARVRQLAKDSRVMAIIKADAYGHGLIRAASHLADADAFGVACMEEARELRHADINKRIMLLEGPYSGEELAEISDLDLEIMVHDPSQLEMLENTRVKKPLVAWMKIDTGMHRLGFLPEQVESAWARLQSCPAIDPKVHLATHLAVATERDNPMTEQQIETFADLTADKDTPKSIANSAGVLAFPESHADWVRPGIMLYGISPMSDSTARDEQLQPVMTLHTRLIAVKTLKKNECVGYGATWRCPEDMPVGIVAAGYGDGYPRHAPSGTPVLVNGQRVTLIGRASMDMLNVDLRQYPAAKVGDPVVLWGDGLPVEEVANHAGTIPYELLCGVHKRLRLIEHG